LDGLGANEGRDFFSSVEVEKKNWQIKRMSFGILLIWAARPAREERRKSARADGFVRKKGFGDVCAQRNDLPEQ
jgi:hypothetical protein